MTERNWHYSDIGTEYAEDRSITDWNESEWSLQPNTHGLFIVQPKKAIQKFELWLRCSLGKGERYYNKGYKCVATFDSLAAAKTGYIFYESTLS
jgi:hypothetical protein